MNKDFIDEEKIIYQLQKSKIIKDEDYNKDNFLLNSLSKTESLEMKRDIIDLDSKRSFYFHRNKWSWFIIVWISVLILFNGSLTIMIGEGWLDFKHYKWFITTVTAETFLQIVGLGYVAAHFLFSNIDKK